MSATEIIELRPLGWETDPAEERFKLSTIDPTPNCAYNHYVLFFRMKDENRVKVAGLLKGGLERTLRYLCGTIEKDPSGGHSFVKTKNSKVQYVVKNHASPSLEDLEEAQFACKAMGDLSLWSANPWMTWGEGKPEADPDHGAVVAAYQANFVRGGLVFSIFPRWDPACIDASRFTRHAPESAQVDGPAAAPRHPGHPEQQALLFHLPKSKAAALKKTASLTDSAHWISTYDAMCAFLWRQLSRVRLGLHNPDLSSHPYFGEAVNMRPRIHNPDLPTRMMRNVLCGAFGDTAPVPRPTLAEVIASEEEYPLSKLAGYIRGLTESCNQEHMETLIEAIASIRDKRSISLRVDALPPMSVWVTDHRPADVGGVDFGFGRPITHRHLWGEHLSAGLVLIYPPKSSSSDHDEGFTFTATVEKELVPKLIQDSEWSEYFEYRGID